MFINICSAPCVPAPPPITDAELRERVEEADESNLTVSYRVPISLGSPRAETDNKGVECRVFDVVVNQQYIDSVTASNATYQIGFVVSVALQGLEQKYELDLDHNWIMMKNRKVSFVTFTLYLMNESILVDGNPNTTTHPPEEQQSKARRIRRS